jgi:hypothetical protein
MATLELIIVSPSAGLLRSAPGGLGYLQEIYREAGLEDDLSRTQLPDQWLVKSLGRLRLRHPGRLRIRWVDPYSPSGFYLTLRFRIRSFPAIILENTLVDHGEDPATFETLITERLAEPPGTA